MTSAISQIIQLNAQIQDLAKTQKKNPKEVQLFLRKVGGSQVAFVEKSSKFWIWVTGRSEEYAFQENAQVVKELIEKAFKESSHGGDTKVLNEFVQYYDSMIHRYATRYDEKHHTSQESNILKSLSLNYNVLAYDQITSCTLAFPVRTLVLRLLQSTMDATTFLQLSEFVDSLKSADFVEKNTNFKELTIALRNELAHLDTCPAELKNRFERIIKMQFTDSSTQVEGLKGKIENLLEAAINELKGLQQDVNKLKTQAEILLYEGELQDKVLGPEMYTASLNTPETQVVFLKSGLQELTEHPQEKSIHEMETVLKEFTGALEKVFEDTEFAKNVKELTHNNTVEGFFACRDRIVSAFESELHKLQAEAGQKRLRIEQEVEFKQIQNEIVSGQHVSQLKEIIDDAKNLNFIDQSSLEKIKKLQLKKTEVFWQVLQTLHKTMDSLNDQAQTIGLDKVEPSNSEDIELYEKKIENFRLKISERKDQITQWQKASSQLLNKCIQELGADHELSVQAKTAIELFQSQIKDSLFLIRFGQLSDQIQELQNSFGESAIAIEKMRQEEKRTQAIESKQLLAEKVSELTLELGQDTLKSIQEAISNLNDPKSFSEVALFSNQVHELQERIDQIDQAAQMEFEREKSTLVQKCNDLKVQAPVMQRGAIQVIKQQVEEIEKLRAILTVQEGEPGAQQRIAFLQASYPEGTVSQVLKFLHDAQKELQNNHKSDVVDVGQVLKDLQMQAQIYSVALDGIPEMKEKISFLENPKGLDLTPRQICTKVQETRERVIELQRESSEKIAQAKIDVTKNQEEVLQAVLATSSNIEKMRSAIEWIKNTKISQLQPSINEELNRCAKKLSSIPSNSFKSPQDVENIQKQYKDIKHQVDDIANQIQSEDMRIRNSIEQNIGSLRQQAFNLGLKLEIDFGAYPSSRLPEVINLVQQNQKRIQERVEAQKVLIEGLNSQVTRLSSFKSDHHLIDVMKNEALADLKILLEKAHDLKKQDFQELQKDVSRIEALYSPERIQERARVLLHTATQFQEQIEKQCLAMKEAYKQFKYISEALQLPDRDDLSVQNSLERSENQIRAISTELNTQHATVKEYVESFNALNRDSQEIMNDTNLAEEYLKQSLEQLKSSIKSQYETLYNRSQESVQRIEEKGVKNALVKELQKYLKNPSDIVKALPELKKVESEIAGQIEKQEKFNLQRIEALRHFDDLNKQFQLRKTQVINNDSTGYVKKYFAQLERFEDDFRKKCEDRPNSAVSIRDAFVEKAQEELGKSELVVQLHKGAAQCQAALDELHKIEWKEPVQPILDSLNQIKKEITGALQNAQKISQAEMKNIFNTNAKLFSTSSERMKVLKQNMGQIKEWKKELQSVVRQELDVSLEEVWHSGFFHFKAGMEYHAILLAQKATEEQFLTCLEKKIPMSEVVKFFKQTVTSLQNKVAVLCQRAAQVHEHELTSSNSTADFELSVEEIASYKLTLENLLDKYEEAIIQDEKEFERLKV